jgi:hypothetical protein
MAPPDDHQAASPHAGAAPAPPSPWPSSPRTAQPPASHAYVWRSGSALVIRTGTGLPPRCVKCNGPAVLPVKQRTIYWHHPALYLLILAGVLIYAIVALVVRKQASVAPGLCARHRQRRLAWIGAGWLGPVAGILLMAASGKASAITVLGAVVLVVSPILGVVMSQIVAATRIDDGFVHLKGCGEPFLAGLPAWPGRDRGGERG